MMSGEGLLPCLGRHSLRPENGAESPRQVQSRHDLVCDQRLAAARPEQADQACTEPRGTHARGSMSVGGAIARGTEHPYVRVACTSVSTPLN